MAGDLRKLREARGMSLRSVAGQVGINHSHLSRIERGLAQPSLVTVRRLAETLGVAPSTIFAQLPQPTEDV